MTIEHGPTSSADERPSGPRWSRSGPELDDVRRAGVLRMRNVAAVVLAGAVVVALLLPGRSPLEPPPPPAVALSAACATPGAGGFQPGECGLVPVVEDLERFWATARPGADADDHDVEVRLYTGRVLTPCSEDPDEEPGTFYCPTDRTVYLNGGPLTRSTGAFAEASEALGRVDVIGAYLLAHEYGHHLQELDGLLAEVDARGDITGPTSDSVRLELQADCYAGVYLQHARQGLLAGATPGPLRDAILAGGDDQVDLDSGNEIDTSAWTHGSSEQRLRWFGTGYDSADPQSCDTFTAGSL